MKKLKTNFEFADERGEFIEVWRGDQWKEMNFFTASKGVVRGGHYHKETSELFFVTSGLCKVEIINLETEQNEKFSAGYKDIFLVEPYEVHFITAIEDLKVVTLLSRPFNREHPDTYDYAK
mgnify:CR=1 FL=1